jgi:hypothetical protein
MLYETLVKTTRTSTQPLSSITMILILCTYNFCKIYRQYLAKAADVAKHVTVVEDSATHGEHKLPRARRTGVLWHITCCTAQSSPWFRE